MLTEKEKASILIDSLELKERALLHKMQDALMHQLSSSIAISKILSDVDIRMKNLNKISTLKKEVLENIKEK